MTKFCFTLFSLVFILSLFSCNQNQNRNTITNTVNTRLISVSTDQAVEINTAPLIDSSKLMEAKVFCRRNKLDTTIAFFVDMRIHPGKNRFFVYQFTTNEILHTGLCCHGMGGQSSATTPVFSNEKGSNCTSLGKYKLGARAYSNWGINIHYKMHGLDTSNTNAFSRIVVLHSYQQVPDHEIYPSPLPLGWSQGCPVISNELMTNLDSLLKKRKMPVLLWIYK